MARWTSLILLLASVGYGTYRTTYNRDTQLYTYDVPLPWTIAYNGSAGDKQIQFNNSGLFGGDQDFTYDSSTDTLTVDNQDVNDLDVTTSLQAGGATHNSVWDVNGTLTLSGDARAKKELQLFPTDFSPGSSGATVTNIGNYEGHAYTISDDMIADFGLPKDWDSSTNIEVVIVWAIDEAYATNSGEVQWQIAWSACPDDGTEAIDAPTHTGTIDYGDQNIPATAKYLTKTSAGTISSSSLSVGDQIGMTLSRVALDDGANPTAEPIIFHVKVHYTMNKLGEAL